MRYNLVLHITHATRKFEFLRMSRHLETDFSFQKGNYFNIGPNVEATVRSIYFEMPTMELSAILKADASVYTYEEWIEETRSELEGLGWKFEYSVDANNVEITAEPSE